MAFGNSNSNNNVQPITPINRGYTGIVLKRNVYSTDRYGRGWIKQWPRNNGARPPLTNIMTAGATFSPSEESNRIFGALGIRNTINKDNTWGSTWRMFGIIPLWVSNYTNNLTNLKIDYNVNKPNVAYDSNATYNGNEIVNIAYGSSEGRGGWSYAISANNLKLTGSDKFYIKVKGLDSTIQTKRSRDHTLCKIEASNCDIYVIIDEPVRLIQQGDYGQAHYELFWVTGQNVRMIFLLNERIEMASNNGAAYLVRGNKTTGVVVVNPENMIDTYYRDRRYEGEYYGFLPLAYDSGWGDRANANKLF